MTFRSFFKIAIMNQTETLQMQMPFSFAEIKKPVVNNLQQKKLRFEKNLGTSINNYLKTPEEIDAEFSLEMNSSKKTFTEHTSHPDIFGRILNNSNSNTYNSDFAHSGFMEENY